ncbi:MAG: sigma-70 family RNA polymerase sigma factor [Pirellulaceae bacterium]|nr:sigma-70 family RNA polymerase sigma factor [Pirellulaceae bacterium]
MTGPTPPADESSQPWVARYQPWLSVLARMEIDSRYQAKFSASDAVQQTLFEAWQGRDQFRGTSEGERMAWLRKILANQLARLARHYGAVQKRDAAREISLDQSLAASSMRLDGLLAADTSSPSAQAMRRERQVLLADVLERLPADYREVIILRNLEDLPHEEVARRMNRSPGAVRMLWLRALTQLRNELQQILSAD